MSRFIRSSFRRILWGRTAALTCGAFGLLFAASAHAQQESTPPQPTPPASSSAAVTPEIKKLTIDQEGQARRVIGQVLYQAGIKSYIIGPDVSGELSLHLTNVPLDTALDRIARSYTPPLNITRATDGSYLIRGGDKGPTQLALSTPPASVSVQQAAPAPPTLPSVSITGGDPVAVALELQIIALRVERETGAKTKYGPANLELRRLDAQIEAMEKQLALHKAKINAEVARKTAQASRPK